MTLSLQTDNEEALFSALSTLKEAVADAGEGRVLSYDEHTGVWTKIH